MKTIILLLIVISCSHKPQSAPVPHEELPKVMEGLTLQKRTFYEIQGAYNLLRNTKEATIAAWINPTELSDKYQNLVNLSVGGNNESWKSRASFLITPKGELQSTARAQDHEEGSEVTTVPDVLKANEWQHVALTINYAKKKMHFYVNGVKVPLAKENYKFMTQETSDTASNRSSLGAEDDGSSAYYSGKITGVQIERSELDEDEIKKLMEETKP